MAKDTLKQFTLFMLCPNLKSMEDEPHTIIKQRCTKGHVWQYPFKVVGISLELEFFQVPRKDYCLFCFIDLLDKHVGLVQPIETDYLI